MRDRRIKAPTDPATPAFQEGWQRGATHPLFRTFTGHVTVVRRPGNLCPDDGWALVTQNGVLHVQPTRRADPDEWLYVLAHLLLHLGFGHLDDGTRSWKEWDAACDYVVGRFLADLKVGRPPPECQTLADLGGLSEDDLDARFR